MILVFEKLIEINLEIQLKIMAALKTEEEEIRVGIFTGAQISKRQKRPQNIAFFRCCGGWGLGRDVNRLFSVRVHPDMSP